MSVEQQPAEQLQAELSAMVEQGELPGAIVRIEQGGETLVDVRVGYQDTAAQTLLAEDSIFRLYSMSKPITSVAIMMLAEQGLLSLDDPAERFLPEFSHMRVYESGGVDDMVTVPIKRPITIADLLSHSSGITWTNWWRASATRPCCASRARGSTTAIPPPCSAPSSSG